MLWGKSVNILNYRNRDKFNTFIQEVENKMRKKYRYKDKEYDRFVILEIPKSSGIFIINDSVTKKSFDKPTFVAIHKILIKTHAKTKTPSTSLPPLSFT